MLQRTPDDLSRPQEYFCPVRVPETGPAIIRRLFEIVNEQRIPRTVVCKEAGVGYRTMENWRSRSGANLTSFIAVAEVLGYDVVLKKRGAK